MLHYCVVIALQSSGLVMATLRRCDQCGHGAEVTTPKPNAVSASFERNRPTTTKDVCKGPNFDPVGLRELKRLGSNERRKLCRVCMNAVELELLFN